MSAYVSGAEIVTGDDARGEWATVGAPPRQLTAGRHLTVSSTPGP